jgi:hypothetical protein
MNETVYKQIQETAQKFADTAKRVNISSRLRTNHIREALGIIIYLESIESNVIEDLNNVSYKDSNKREGDLYIQSMCEQLKDDISAFTKMVTGFQKNRVLEKEVLKKIIRIHNDFKTTINDVIKRIDTILNNDNVIIEKDGEIVKLKKSQHSLLESLHVDTQKSCVDAVRAVKGSKSNLLRGLKMVQNFKRIETLIEFNDLDALTILYNNTKVGWEIAESVNQSSASQLEFAEKVYVNTQKLHDQSQIIRNLVSKRTETYHENVNSFNFITNTMSEKIIKHKNIADVNEYFESHSSDDEITKLKNHIDTIVKNSEGILRQNIQNSYYSENESGTFEMINEENYFYDKIIDEIEFMTETTHYPIQGSKDNIQNGQTLEKLLVQVLNDMGIPVQLSQ